ncbi:MAG: PIN domain-containing protein [Candidatus Dormibacteraeota bacterium]|nr:PIN domain-containing protein [Candidatus Dormibacteraeota bacterium]
MLDTSLFVATESGRPLGEMTGVTETDVSVVTVAELTVCVLMAGDDARPARVATLSEGEATWDRLPIGAVVARQFAQIVASQRASGRWIPALDALLAATAIVQRIPFVTQDNEFEVIPGLEVVRV